jgi:peptide/nickel transport system ATP-binding protein
MAVTDAPSSNAVVVRNLRIELVSSGEDIVDQIVLEVTAGEVLGLVGESGSGKTTVGMALLGYTRPGGKVVSGEVMIDGRDLQGLREGELRRLRGGTVSYIPQDPGTALNPALRIGRQLSEMLEAHAPSMSEAERDARVRESLGEVALPPQGVTEEEFLKRYPHQLSGGQQQRVAIARALANSPRVLIADEPTGQLDADTGATVMALLQSIVKSEGMTAIISTHDPSVQALADQTLRLADGVLTA